MITKNEFLEIGKNHLKVRNDGSAYIDDPKLAKQYAEYLDAQNATTKGKKGKISPALSGITPLYSSHPFGGYDIEFLISGDGLKSVFQQLFELQAFPNQVIIENFKLDISEPTDLTIITNDPKNIDIEVTIPIKVNSTDDDEGIIMPVPVPVAAFFSFTQNPDNTIALVLIDIDISPLPSGLFDKNKIINEINLDLDVISSTISNQALSTFNDFKLKKLASTGNSSAAYGIYINLALNRNNPITGTPTRICNINNSINFLDENSDFAVGCPLTLFTDLLTDYCNNNLKKNIPQIDYPGPWETTQDGHPVTIKDFTFCYGTNSNNLPSIIVKIELHVGDEGFWSGSSDVNYYATITPSVQTGQLLLAYTSYTTSGDITSTASDKVKSYIDGVINTMLNEAKPLVNNYPLCNPIKLSPYSTLQQFFSLNSYKFYLSNIYQLCLIDGLGLSVWGKIGFTSAPVLSFTNWRITFNTTSDDKDGDTKILVEILSLPNGQEIAVYNGFGAPDGSSNCGFPNNSTNVCQLSNVNMPPLYVSDLGSAQLKITITPNGHDNWVFNYTLEADVAGVSGVTTYSYKNGMDLNQDSNVNIVSLKTMAP